LAVIGLRRLGIAAILAAFVALALTGGTQAHALYVRSDPAASAILPLASAPARVNVTLSEPPQLSQSSIRVTNVSGDRFDSGPVTILPSDSHTMSIGLAGVGSGIYTVAWSTVSAADGHFTYGSFSFAIENADGTLPGRLPPPGEGSVSQPLSAGEVLFRFALFLGFVIGTGASAFFLAAWRRIADSGARGDVAARGSEALLRWGRIGAVLMALAAAGLWWNAAGTQDPFALGASPFLASLAMWLGLGVAMALTFSLALRAAGRRRLALVATALAFGIAAAVLGSLGTHAAALSGWGAAGIALDAAHLLGIAAWVGGLFAIVRVRSYLLDPAAAPWARAVVAGFSRLAGYAVVVVLGAGFGLAVLLVGSVNGLVSTGYGWTVLAKVSLFVPMIGLGAYNRWRLLPAAEKENPAAIPSIARNVRVEMTLGAAVLALAAILTALAPAIASAPAGAPGGNAFVREATTGGLVFRLQVDPYPNAPGVYTFTLTLWNASGGGPFFDGRNASLTFKLQNSTDAPDNVPMTGPDGNRFVVVTPALSKAGTWRIDALAQPLGGFYEGVVFYIQA